MDDRGRDRFVGVDWASQTHHVFVVDARGRKLGERGFTHGGEGWARNPGFHADVVARLGVAPFLRA